VKRCYICERPLDHDHDEFQPEGHYVDDRWDVVIRNGQIVESCWSCWFRWPDPFKQWPARGFGRRPHDEPKRSHISIEEIVELCGGPA
jgi:hypothetical protein